MLQDGRAFDVTPSTCQVFYDNIGWLLISGYLYCFGFCTVLWMMLQDTNFSPSKSTSKCFILCMVNIFHVQKFYRGRKDVRAAHVQVRDQFYRTYGKCCKKVDRWLYQTLIFLLLLCTPFFFFGLCFLCCYWNSLVMML